MPVSGKAASVTCTSLQSSSRLKHRSHTSLKLFILLLLFRVHYNANVDYLIAFDQSSVVHLMFFLFFTNYFLFPSIFLLRLPHNVLPSNIKLVKLVNVVQNACRKPFTVHNNVSFAQLPTSQEPVSCIVCGVYIQPILLNS